MSDMQIGQRPAYVSQDWTTNETVQTDQAGAKELLPVLGGGSVSVSFKTVDVFAMVERLKLAVKHKNEETQQTVMSAAISSILGRIAATDAEQAKLLADLGKQTDRYMTLVNNIEHTVAECCARDPNVKTLEMKVKELEATVERLRKTPEEKKAELEKKERELESAQKELDAARLAALANDPEYRRLADEIEETEQNLAGIRRRLDSNSLHILSQALLEVFYTSADPEVGEDDRGRVADCNQFFVALLGGDELQACLDELAAGREDFA